MTRVFRNKIYFVTTSDVIFLMNFRYLLLAGNLRQDVLVKKYFRVTAPSFSDKGRHFAWSCRSQSLDRL